VVPSLPEGSPAPPEDRLAFFRDPHEFRNVTFVELDNGDFAHTVTRVLLFAAARLALYRRLQLSRDPVLAAVAARAGRELAYHRDYAGRWVLTLARGTAESRRRLLAALDELWPRYAELFAPHGVEVTLAAAGVGVDPSHLVPEVASALAPVFEAGGVTLAELAGLSVAPGPAGRDGAHTDALTLMLARMQVVARAHPMGRW
jgi:ring-1,2-phenylacetyl-CoA epoxidase subunit PaaC